MKSHASFYKLVGFLTLASYGWVAFLRYYGTATNTVTLTLCPINLLTGYPCPSCGTSRSIIHLLEGGFLSALIVNPLGYFAFLLMAVTPLWMLYDLILKKRTFYHAFINVEKNLIQHKWLLFLFFILIAINWAWNIVKLKNL